MLRRHPQQLSILNSQLSIIKPFSPNFIYSFLYPPHQSCCPLSHRFNSWLGPKSFRYPTLTFDLRNQLATSPSFQAGGQLFFSPRLHQSGVPFIHSGNNRSPTSTAYVIKHKTTSTIRSTGTTPLGQPSRGLVGFPDGWPHPTTTSHTWYTSQSNVLITFTLSQKRRRMVKSWANKPL